MTPPVNRRAFLAGAGTTAAGLAFGTGGTAEAATRVKSEEWRNRQPGMAYRRLGRTGYMISEIVMGGNHIAPDNNDHVREAVDRGLNYLDTSPAYGNGRSEEGYGRLLKRSSFRERVFLNSKVSVFNHNRAEVYTTMYEGLSGTERRGIDREVEEWIARRGVLTDEYFGPYFGSQERMMRATYLANVMERRYPGALDRKAEYYDRVIASVEESLTRLNTDHLDIFMCPHGTNTPEEVAIPEMHEALDRLKRDGKIRAAGFSCHTDSAGVLEAALDTGQYDACMIAYNVINGDYVETAIRHAYEQDVGVISMKAARPVFPNRGPDDYVAPQWLAKLHRAVPGDQWSVAQKAYLWVLANPNLTASVSDMHNIDIVNSNLPLAGVNIERQPLADMEK